MVTEEMLGYVLKDDATATGGVDHIGETFGEFLESIGMDYQGLRIDEANEILTECGISPLM